MKRARFVPPPPREGFEVVHGLRAGLAVIARRPHDVQRVAYSHLVRQEVTSQTRAALSRGLPCAESSDRELDELAKSSHHEGLCVVAKPRAWASAQDVAEAVVRARGCAIALDRVRNPYNVGAILRTAAFFGLEGAWIGAPAPHSGLASTAVRVAEGGAEELRIARTTDLADTLVARARARRSRRGRRRTRDGECDRLPLRRAHGPRSGQRARGARRSRTDPMRRHRRHTRERARRILERGRRGWRPHLRGRPPLSGEVEQEGGKTSHI